MDTTSVLHERHNCSHLKWGDKGSREGEGKLSPSGGRPLGQRVCFEAEGARTEKPAAPQPLMQPSPAHSLSHACPLWSHLRSPTHTRTCTCGFSPTNTNMFTATYSQTLVHPCAFPVTRPHSQVQMRLWLLAFYITVRNFVVASSGGGCTPKLRAGEEAGV